MKAKKNIFIEIFRIEDLRYRFFFTLGALLIFRLGALLPIPGIDISILQSYINNQDGGRSFADYFNFFSGGAFSNFSIFMLGIMPYISMSIIMQLLLVASPAMKKISEQEGGRKKIKTFTRYGTVFVSIVQSYLTVLYAQQISDAIVIPMWQYTFLAMLTVTTGSVFLMWLADQINVRGIGNGASLFIFTGILIRIPDAIASLVSGVQNGSINAIFLIISVLLFIVIIALIVYEQKGQRRIPIQYSRRLLGGEKTNAQSTYIPLKLNPSGVIPVIFASAILNFPATVLENLKSDNIWMIRLIKWLDPTSVVYLIVYLVLIVFFAYFYAQVTINPQELTKNIHNAGGSIPGIRPDEMKNYIVRVLNRIILPGALFLGLIAIIPNLIMIIFQFPPQIAYVLGGTSLLILVGVDLDLVSQVEARLKTHQYSSLFHNPMNRKGL